jgi:hypothetical protein
VFEQCFTNKKCYLKKVVFVFCSSAFSQCLFVNKHSQRIQRLEFANAYRHWDEDEWKQVMFPDEAKNMDEWKREMTELWTLRMSDGDYLRKLVVSMPKRLAEVIEKDGWTTHYLSVDLYGKKLPFLQKKMVVFLYFVPRSQFLRR